MSISARRQVTLSRRNEYPVLVHALGLLHTVE